MPCDIVKISYYIATGIMGIAGLFADIVIGHELAMHPGRTCTGSDRAELVVDRKVSDLFFRIFCCIFYCI